MFCWIMIEGTVQEGSSGRTESVIWRVCFVCLSDSGQGLPKRALMDRDLEVHHCEKSLRRGRVSGVGFRKASVADVSNHIRSARLPTT